MRYFRHFLLAVLLLGPVPLAADQNDPRLDSLFDALHAAPTVEEARAVEARIWKLWIRSDVEDVNILMVQGITAMSRGDNDTALAVFDRMVDLAPSFAEGWNKRATVNYLIGDYDASVRDIQQTLLLEERHFGAISGLGLIYLALGDDAAALRAFRQVLDIYPLAPGTREQVDRLAKKVKGTPT